MEESDENIIIKQKCGRKSLPEDIRESRKKESYKKYRLNRKNIGSIVSKEDLGEQILFLERVIFLLQFQFILREKSTFDYKFEKDSDFIKKSKKKELNDKIKFIRKFINDICCEIMEKSDNRMKENEFIGIHNRNEIKNDIKLIKEKIDELENKIKTNY